ncbi:hypothetical protein [Streptomyces sp. NPDC059819]|uniref:hypothetical protein n=1 Tax=Streptomyces sp. NPDC059819 TaxID=3346963 RepID=UPI00364AB55E
MQFITRLVCRAAVVAAALGATAALTSGPASAAPASAQYWSPQCDWGSACIYLAHTPGKIWNLNACGYNPIQDHYSWAKAHGNAFTVHYANGTWDRVEAWTERPLDGNNLVTSVDVFC